METALITGASSGIGYELAKVFAKNKINLVLIARNGEKLQKLKQEVLEINKESQITIIVADLSVSGSSDHVFNQLQKSGIKVDYLVNNAGFGLYGKFKDTDIQKEQ